MTNEWLKALERSIIDKWVPLTKGELEREPDCELCTVANNSYDGLCYPCPMDHEGYPGCGKGLYRKWVYARLTFGPQSTEARRAAKEMLSELLDAHPEWRRAKRKFYQEHGV